jgi:hypothetical protein
MKIIISIIGLTLIGHCSVQAGSMEIIKQKAKNLNEQNNAQQGINAPATPAPSSAPATQPAPLLPPDPTAKVRAAIANVLCSTTATPEMKQQFTRDLLATARGSHKPTAATVGRLTESLATALAGRTLGTSEQSRLAANLNLAMNSASLSSTRTDEIADDAQAIVHGTGASAGSASTVANRLKAVCAELQSAASP